ncbi:hypothetical protein JCGZ_23138 [Jatropha curcas]|uniref:Uncharacterized protein n=1 Tax=Jatropha curcas TaxID=180498 RepID=A0A067JTI8_JATCU|nr:hypothetical protein JCGZ_23138 [Jatropha curcas]
MEDQIMEEENQRYEENSGKMNWILDKGLALGKRILVTGFVISSAPVIVPPLMVISALGFACSVPYGIFLASYACTEKLMSKLLPSPTTTSVEDYRIEQEEKYGGENADKELVYGKDEVVEKNGYEEDVDKDADKEEEKASKENDMQIEGMGGKNEEEPVIGNEKDAREEIHAVMVVIEGEEKSGSDVREAEAPFEVTDVAVELCQGGDNEDNKLVMETRKLIEKIKDEVETRELIEKIKDEVEATKLVAEDKQSAEEGLEKTDINVEETVTETLARNANGHVVIETRTIVEKIEENCDKGEPVESVELKEMGTIESVPAVSKEIAITSNADESGSELARVKNGAQTQYSSREGIEQSSHTAPKNFDSLERASEPERGGVPSENDPGMASNEVLYSEKTIWKKINAMRKIVGYTTARHGTCIEELKALYVFTGVEPPASFKETSDLVEVNDKLRFLMSIVGVK